MEQPPHRRHHYRERDRSVSPPRYRNRSPPPRSQARSAQYSDRDREGYRSPRRSSRSRSNSRGGERDRSPWHGAPSRDIIMEGLPVDLLEQDVGFPPPLIFPSGSLRSWAKF
jgi:hypothetical protein